MDTPITRSEHNEFARRIEDENRRTNRRLEILEKSSERIGDLVLSIEKLAIGVETLANEQKEQCTKLQQLEERDGEMWRKVISHVITTIIGAVISFVFVKMGM